MKSPIRETDAEAIELAQSLISSARIAALGSLEQSGTPHVTRIAFSWIDGPVTLISDLSHHTRHLKADPRASLMVGEVAQRGDPLNQPRLTMICKARFVDEPLRDGWLAEHPKSKLYVDFADFNFVRFDLIECHLNGGFGKAYHLTASDLTD